MAYITAHLPTHGEYGLEIYANEPMKEGDTFTHICQYLCTWLEKDFRAQYGQVYDRADLSFLNHTLPLSYAGQSIFLNTFKLIRCKPQFMICCSSSKNLFNDVCGLKVLVLSS